MSSEKNCSWSFSRVYPDTNHLAKIGLCYLHDAFAIHLFSLHYPTVRMLDCPNQSPMHSCCCLQRGGAAGGDQLASTLDSQQLAVPLPVHALGVAAEQDAKFVGACDDLLAQQLAVRLHLIPTAAVLQD